MEWMTAIADVLRSFRLLLDATRYNFFKDRLWETVDGEWMECLRKGPCRISSVSLWVGSAATVIDVGAGQGYLAQVLSFLYHLSVIALDASPPASVTSLRAERIKKHFTVKSRKSHNTLTAVLESMIESSSCDNERAGSPLVLAGLHACECEQVKAIVCISCCYNLLSDEHFAKSDSCSFPMSKGGKLLGLALEESEERWRSFTKEAAIQNFELHASVLPFRKTLRRRQLRRVLNSQLDGGERSIEFSAKGQFADCSCTTSGIKDVCGSSSKFCLFEEFSRAGLSRLGIETQIILTSWEYGRMFNLSLVVLMHLIMQDLIGPYWALHAALGPLVETYLLLIAAVPPRARRWSGSEDGPLFDPLLSPRNVAIIALKK
ncbi:unnamed protein product [Spirodela intermedia]|uniref:Methyltransferase domain-containing protein n=1 Tax=Spirodela intermedia TaxID=51605 RepID=A0ABN7EAN0_SPIIN|nr:unnamed protein product [Spirodela intermedia]